MNAHDTWLARIVSDEKSPSLIKALERSWSRFHGPMQQMKVDEYAGWGSDARATWAENHDIELKISPGQVHTRTSSVVERRHQLLRRAVQIYMDDNGISGVDAVHEALTWVIPSLNEHTFLNGFTPTQLAMGRQPTIPGLTSEERTKPPQLSEGQHLQEILQCRSRAQQACAKADVDVRLRKLCCVNIVVRMMIWLLVNAAFNGVSQLTSSPPSSGKVLPLWLQFSLTPTMAMLTHTGLLMEQC